MSDIIQVSRILDGFPSGVPQSSPSGGGGPPLPSLIQMVAASSLAPAISTVNGNDFSFTAPNAVLAGNCLVMMITYENQGETVTISDTVNGSWPAAVVTADAGSTANICSIFVFPNAGAGITTPTVHFSATHSSTVFDYEFTEWNNVATVSPANGTAFANTITGPSLACGSFTPGNNDANGGNLILAYFCMIHEGSSGIPTNWVPGGSFNLLHGDIWWGTQGVPKASMYFVQTTHAAINPSITATGDSADNFNCVAVALKAASAGNPIPAGIHVNKLLQFFTNGTATNAKMLLPATGNLRILTASNGTQPSSPLPITDNEGGGNWASVVHGDIVVAYSPNKSPNQNLVVTFSQQTICWKFWDIQGAAVSPFDTSVSGTGTTANVSVINDEPDITPTTANGLVIGIHSLGIGPGLGLASGAPANAVSVLTNYTAKIDSDTFDSGDCDAFVYNATTATIHWNWSVTNNPNSGGDYMSVAFKKA